MCSVWQVDISYTEGVLLKFHIENAEITLTKSKVKIKSSFSVFCTDRHMQPRTDATRNGTCFAQCSWCRGNNAGHWGPTSPTSLGAYKPNIIGAYKPYNVAALDDDSPLFRTILSRNL